MSDARDINVCAFTEKEEEKWRRIREFAEKFCDVNRRSLEVKTCLTVRREKLQTDGSAPTFVVHEALGSGIARCSRSPLIGVPCKLVVCVLRKFRWYARTHRLKSEREREPERERERQRYRKRERTARTTRTYTRERQTATTTDTFIPCVYCTLRIRTHTVHLRGRTYTHR